MQRIVAVKLTVRLFAGEQQLDCLLFRAVFLVVLEAAQRLTIGDLMHWKVASVIGNGILHPLVDFTNDLFQHGGTSFYSERALALHDGA